MNIKKIDNTQKLLTIDDPSVYHEFDDKVFIHAEIRDSYEHIGTDTSILYLVETDTIGQYIPYVYGENGEPTKLINPFSRGQTLPYPKLSNGSNDLKMKQLNENLVAIDNHLYALRKQLSYWNLYQIGYSVESAESFSPTIAALSPGEALIINIDGQFEYEGNTYTRGDLVIRLTDGTYTTITSSLSGFYYPHKIEKNANSYKLTYKYYQEGAPEKSEAELKNNEELDKPYEKEYFEVKGASASGSFIYGERKDVSDTNEISFDAVEYEDAIIPPILKFFTEDGEEIGLDFTCKASDAGTGTRFVASFSSKPSNLKYLYIK